MTAPDAHEKGSALPLSAQVVGISISDSEDLSRRGYLPVHLERALAEIATLLAAAGARIGYGGHLQPDGFTHNLFRSVAEMYGGPRVASAVPPCIHYLAIPIWRKMPASDLIEHVRSLSGTVEVVLVATRGQACSLRLEQMQTPSPSAIVRLAPRLPHTVFRADSLITDQVNQHTLSLYESAHNWHSKHIPGTQPPPFSQAESFSKPCPELPTDISSPNELADLLHNYLTRVDLSDPSAFTEMRLFMAADEDARVVLGGKTRNYAGHFPGIAEESLYSLLAGNRVVGLRGFGGCAEDVVDALLSGELRERPGTGPGNATILGSLAAGTDIFLDTLARAGLSDIYPQTASLDSPRAMAIGVLRCLKQALWREVSIAEVDCFRKAVL